MPPIENGHKDGENDSTTDERSSNRESDINAEVSGRLVQVKLRVRRKTAGNFMHQSLSYILDAGCLSLTFLFEKKSKISSISTSLKFW